MKKMENSFVVSGFVGKDASIHQFSSQPQALHVSLWQSAALRNQARKQPALPLS